MSFLTPALWQKGEANRVHRLPQCGRCGLFKECSSPKMKPSGEGKRKILFLGEAPGKTEDEQGTQFVGESGQRLREVLSSLDCELDDCILDNAARCRPPENEIEQVHIDSCRPLTLKTLQEHKPNVIILLGGSAVKSLVHIEKEDAKGSITKWVGWNIPSQEHGAWICPTYHPSFIIRSDDPVLNLIWKRHLRQALKLEHEEVPRESLEDLKGQCEIIKNPRLGRKRLKDLARKKGILAFDYEATGRKPDHPEQRIVAVSACLEGEDTFSTVYNEDLRGALRRVLRNPKLRKTASNIKNEERWSVVRVGTRVLGWEHDTMLAAHTLDNRKGITGLKFQTYVRFGIADYDAVVAQYFEEDERGFNRIMECPLEDLLIYNALDSLLEFRLRAAQRKEMGL